jgi:exoribonuclease R
MLHPDIIKSCSFKLGEPRLAISLIFIIDEDGVIDAESYEYFESVI